MTTNDIALDIQATVPVIRIMPKQECDHRATRPATIDDQRPYCVNCRTIVEPEDVTEVAAQFRIGRKMGRYSEEDMIMTMVVSFSDEELRILNGAISAILSERDAART